MPDNLETDDDRITCPFCNHLHYPGTKTAHADEWIWEGDVCKHTLFVAVDISSFSGFEFRSNLFNEHLNLPDDDDPEVEISSEDDEDSFLSIQEIISKLALPGMELRSYTEAGGAAGGPSGSGSVTFGFVPDQPQTITPSQ
jgi:hypothetical protein